MTHSIDKTLHQFANLLPNWTLLPILILLPNFGGFHRTLQRMRLANRGRLLLRTPGPVPFGTCICSNVETILSWTCHVYGPFEFLTSLGTSILLLFFRSCSELLSKFGEISFQEYVSEGISHLLFYGDLVYKLRRVKCVANFVSKIVKRLRRRKYDPVIIERTIGLVIGPSTALNRSFPKHCTLTKKAVGLYDGTCSNFLRGDKA